MHEPILSTIKRKQKLQKELLEEFGYDQKDCIDIELSRSDPYFLQGLDYQEIYQIVKKAVIHLIQSRSPGSFKASSKFSYNSVDSPLQFKKKSISEDSQKHETSAKSKENWEEFQRRHANFSNDFTTAKSVIERPQQILYSPLPPLDIQAKIDEVKAVKAAKEREEQSLGTDFKKRLERFIAEQEKKEVLEKQINEKKRIIKNKELEDKAYAQELEQRNRVLSMIETQERDKQKKAKDEYSQALLDQVSHKQKQRLMMRRLSEDCQQIWTPSTESFATPQMIRSNDSNRSDAVSGNKASSPLKFLMQYGNYVISNGK